MINIRTKISYIDFESSSGHHPFISQTVLFISSKLVTHSPVKNPIQKLFIPYFFLTIENSYRMYWAMVHQFYIRFYFLNHKVTYPPMPIHFIKDHFIRKTKQLSYSWTYALCLIVSNRLMCCNKKCIIFLK